MQNKFIRFLLRHPILVVLAILVLPLFIGAAYALPLPQIIVLDSSSLISYYGVAFGLIGSMLVYLDDKAKQRLANRREAVPNIAIKIRKSNGVLEATLKNKGKTKVEDIYLYDERLGIALDPDRQESVCFRIDAEEQETGVVDVRGYDNFSINECGYPSYVQICLSDDLGRGWNLVYERAGEADAPEYPLINAELTSW